MAPARLVKMEPPMSESSESLYGRQRRKQSVARASAYSHRGAMGPGRSDAPTPSEGMFDEVPLLREIRDVRMPRNSQNANRNDSFMDMDDFREFAENLKHFNNTLGELHAIGVQHDVQLPELVLLGDQSAGKSSLMSGLARINLPRSGGICTRCVTHIRVSHHPEKSIRVSLRQKYAYRPPEDGIVSVEDVTARDPFPPWEPQAETVLDFKTIPDPQDPGDIENLLRWAQIAILNPNFKHDQFIPGSGAATLGEGSLDKEARTTQAQFSPNVVALEIKGPQYPDLSFYDLPGVFANTPNEEDLYLVKVVKNLATAYILHEEAILIWAVPMNGDPNNSNMFNLIRELDAQDRTIGVMTKADLLPNTPIDQSHEQWLAALNGAEFQTGHGYFITSRRPGEALDIQDQWEEHFFNDETDGVTEWPREKFAMFQQRCGLGNLKNALSEKLADAFRKCLPSVKEKVSRRLKSAKDGLAELPELPRNSEAEIRVSLKKFVDTVMTRLRGDDFASQYEEIGKEFNKALLNMKPKVSVMDPSDFPQVGSAADKPVVIDDDDNDARARPNKRKPPTGASPSVPETPVKRTKRENAPSSGRLATPNLLANPAQPRGQSYWAFKAYQGPEAVKLRDIRAQMNKKSTAFMLDTVGEKAYSTLCKPALQLWEGPLLMFLELVMKNVRETVELTLKQSFSSLQKRHVFTKAKEAIGKFLEEQESLAKQYLLRVLKTNTNGVSTINEDEFRRLRSQEEDALHHYRHYMRWKAFSPVEAQPTYVALEKMTQADRSQDDRKRKNEVDKMGPDPFRKEIEVFAYVRGFYRLASVRLADQAILILYWDMLNEIEHKLVDGFYLDEALGIFPSDRPDIGAVFTDLMKEEQWIANRRESLKSEVEKFEKAMKSITELERQTDQVNGDEIETLSTEA